MESCNSQEVEHVTALTNNDSQNSKQEEKPGQNSLSESTTDIAGLSAFHAKSSDIPENELVSSLRSMDEQVTQNNIEIDSSPSEALPESQTGKQKSEEICDKSEHEGMIGAGDVPPVAGDSGCQIEDERSCQPLTNQQPGESNTVSSGESSPVSSQGQDSGLSPDEAMIEASDDQTSPSAGNLLDAAEARPYPQNSGPLPPSEGDNHQESNLVETKPEEVVSPSGHTSPEGSGGLSETQVTVSDLDSPASPTPLAGGATAVADASGAVACATDATPLSASASSTSKDKKEMESVYYIKWIMFDGGSVPIITQNENGPCPLLALVNVLLLKGKVCYHSLVILISLYTM